MRIRRIGGHAARISRRQPGSRAPADLRCAAARARRWAGRMTTTTQGVSPCRSGRTEAISSPTADCCIPKNVRNCGDERDGPIGTIARASPTPGPARATRQPPSFQSTRDRRCCGVYRSAWRCSSPRPGKPSFSCSSNSVVRSDAHPGGRFAWRKGSLSVGGRPTRIPLLPAGACAPCRCSCHDARRSVRCPRRMGVWSWAPTMSRTVPLRRRTKW